MNYSIVATIELHIKKTKRFKYYPFVKSRQFQRK